MLASYGNHEDTVELLCLNKADIEVSTRDGLSALLVASQQGNYACAEILLKYHANINQQDCDKMTALYWAALEGHNKIISLLCNSGADPNLPDIDGYTPIFEAAKKGHVDSIALLLKHGAIVNHQTNHNTTALNLASEHGVSDAVTLLLEMGSNPNLVDNDGDSPLISASAGGHLSCVKMLLQHSADANIQNNDKCTALIQASKKGHVDILKLLLDSDPGSIDVCDERGNSPLIWATRQGHLPCVQVLLQFGAKLNLQNHDKMSALAWAVLADQLEIMQLQQSKGADSSTLLLQCTDQSIKNINKHKLLMQACRDGSTEIIQFLCNHHQVDINATDEDGATALREAVMNHRIECVEILLKSNAEVNILGPQRYTVLNTAACFGFEDIMKLLLEHNADPDLPNVDGNTPLICAIINHNMSCIELLLRGGADFTIENNRGESALKYMAENSASQKLLHPETTDIEKYLDMIEPNWDKSDMPTLIFPFPSNEILRAAYLKLIFGCGKNGWKCTDTKYSNIAVFVINRENDIHLVVYPCDSGTKYPIPCLQMDIYCTKSSNDSQRIPATLDKISKTKLLDVNNLTVTSPHVCPCLEVGIGPGMFHTQCLVKCSDLELDTGRYALASCPTHHTIISGDKITRWFKVETSACDKKSIDKFLRVIAKLVTNEEILYDVGLGLDLEVEEIAAIRTDNDRSIVNAGQAVLIEWWKKISTKDIGPHIQEL